MIRFAALGAGILFLGGCALPVPIQIASWALDGLSYITTQKSVADHGLSLVARKDCALLRGLLNEGEFCRDFEDGATVFADKGTGGTEVASLGETESFVDIESLADFETAAGVETGAPVTQAAEMAWPLDSDDPMGLAGYPLEIRVEVQPAPAAPIDDAAIFSFRSAIDDWREFSAAMVDPLPEELPEPAAVADAQGGEPAVGLYFVIGSFRQHENARKLRKQFRALTPSVLSAKLERGTVYRVVVGPFGQQDAGKVHRTIYKAGISDSWAIRVKPGQWSMAMIDPPALKAAPSPVVAGVSRQKRQKTALQFIQELAALVYRP